MTWQQNNKVFRWINEDQLSLRHRRDMRHLHAAAAAASRDADPFAVRITPFFSDHRFVRVNAQQTQPIDVSSVLINDDLFNNYECGVRSSSSMYALTRCQPYWKI